jgi:hypothetical protein
MNGNIIRNGNRSGIVNINGNINGIMSRNGNENTSRICCTTSKENVPPSPHERTTGFITWKCITIVY